MRAQFLRLAGLLAALASVSLPTDGHGPVEGDGSTRSLPEKLVVAYPGNAVCDERVSEAISRGVNVVAWSFGALALLEGGAPAVSLQPDIECVLRVASQHSDVVHLVSFGGWDAPHPDPACDGASYYRAWKEWNESNRRADGQPLFDGFDWDLEGNDDKSSPYNEFSVEVLDIMGVMSTLAKQDGYIVSLAPPESYLDPRAPAAEASFSRSLLLTYPKWEREWKKDLGANYTEPYFGYHGRNCWAYLVAAYGGLGPEGTFDFASVQIYESYSHFAYDVQVSNLTISEGILRAAEHYLEGFVVDFSTDTSPKVAALGKQRISVPAEALVLGFIATSGDPHEDAPAHAYPYKKTFTVMPTEPDSVQRAYGDLAGKGRAPRGFMFWCISEEAGSTIPYYLSEGLAAVVRPSATWASVDKVHISPKL